MKKNVWLVDTYEDNMPSDLYNEYINYMWGGERLPDYHCYFIHPYDIASDLDKKMTRWLQSLDKDIVFQSEIVLALQGTQEEEEAREEEDEEADEEREEELEEELAIGENVETPTEPMVRPPGTGPIELLPPLTFANYIRNIPEFTRTTPGEE